MSEHLEISSSGKEDKYILLIKQIKAVTEKEDDLIARMANIASMIHYTFSFFWTGFYRVKDNILILGPFQGPLACMRIQKGKGVCGTAWQEKKTLVVKNVEEFPGHIACSSESKSEIVVPVIREGRVTAVLDIDSESLATFDDTDRKYLEEIVSLL